MTCEAEPRRRGLLDPLVFLARIARGYSLAKLSGAKFGRIPIVLGGARFHIKGDAVIGERFMTLPQSPKPNLDVARGAVLRIGNGVLMGGGASIEVWHDVRIGNNVMMGPYCSIIDGARQLGGPDDGSLDEGPTVIEDNVWLTRNVTILPGVTVGAGSVIAANTVVSRDIPPNSFAYGSPARVSKRLAIPDGWNRRYGFAQDDNSERLWKRLYRAATDPRDVAGDVPAELVPHDVP